MHQRPVVFVPAGDWRALLQEKITEAARTAHAALGRETYPVRAFIRERTQRRPLIETRTDLLNYLVRRQHYNRYLEIGVSSRGNYDRIRAREKHGVDPAPRRGVTYEMPSDAFFDLLGSKPDAKGYDLVFIDGSHIAEQVERDVANALDWLAPGGTIVLHDCNPITEHAQIETYDGVSQWNGTVWKAWAKFRTTRPDLAMTVVDIDQGCGVICRGKQERYSLQVPYEELDYVYLDAHRRELLNLIDPDEFNRIWIQGSENSPEWRRRAAV